jgi:hypothetical protein
MKLFHAVRNSTTLLSSPIGMVVATSLLLFVVPSTPSRADISYLWHETDGQFVSGTLDVLSSAQPAGMINQSDVVSFSFSTPYPSSYATSDLVASSFPISISKITAKFDNPAAAPLEATYTDAALNVHLLKVGVELGSNSSPPGGFALEYINGTQVLGAQGFWEVTGQAILPPAVPEPNTLIVTGISSFCALIYGLARKLKSSRFKAAQPYLPH